MDAFISSMEFIKENENDCYWKVTLVDENNNYIGTFGDSKITDPVNFRKQTFGILSACNCFDLLKLSSSNPQKLPVYYMERKFNGINSIVNKNGQSLKLGHHGMYEINKAWNFFNKNKEIKQYEIGEIESIESRSGVFVVSVCSGCSVNSFMTGSVYWGFGYPLTQENMNEDYIRDASKLYLSFIEGILKLYNTNDLMKLNGNEVSEYPMVIVKTDEKGNITSIGNKDTGFELMTDGISYIIINKNKEQEKEEVKKKSLNVKITKY